MTAPESPAQSRDDLAIKEFFRVRRIRTDKLDRKDPFENFEYYIRKFENAVEANYSEPDQDNGYEHARSFVFRLMAGSLPASLPEGPDPEKGRDLDGSAKGLTDAARLETAWRMMAQKGPHYPTCSLMLAPDDFRATCDCGYLIIHRLVLDLPKVSEAKPAERSDAEQSPSSVGAARKALEGLDRIERLLLDSGFRMDPEIHHIRKALAEASREGV